MAGVSEADVKKHRVKRQANRLGQSLSYPAYNVEESRQRHRELVQRISAKYRR